MIRATILALVLLIVHGSIHAQGSEVYRRARLYEPYMAQAGVRYGVDPRLLWTIAYLETRFQPGLVSSKGAAGMMQFIPATAARYGLLNPHDPRASIDAAARYLRDLTLCFGGRLDLILAAYNSGEGTVEAFRDGRTLVLPTGKIINPRGIRTGGVPPYAETQSYVSDGASVFCKISSAGIFNAPQIARLERIVIMPVIKRNKVEPTEQPPLPIVELKQQASIYATDVIPSETEEPQADTGGRKSDNSTAAATSSAPPPSTPLMPKSSTTRSIYFQPTSTAGSPH